MLRIFAFILFSSASYHALSASEAITGDEKDGLNRFGFGPAFYVINYNKKVLNESKDVSIRSDIVISSSGSKYSTAIGLEVHYDFSLRPYLCCKNPDGSRPAEWSRSSGHTISPFLGVYDIENGLNGIAAGLLYGYWRGDGKTENRKSLNVGLGWTVHKNRLVLANDLKEGSAPPIDLNSEDFTNREDVKGHILMISASLGF